MVHVVGSREVTVADLAIDRHPFVFTQGRIGSVDAAAHTVDVTLTRATTSRTRRSLGPERPAGLDRPGGPRLRPEPPVANHHRRREGFAADALAAQLSQAPRAPSHSAKRFLTWDNFYKGWGVVAMRTRDFLVKDIRNYARRGRRRHGRRNCPATSPPPLHRRYPARLRPAAGRRRVSASSSTTGGR